MFVNSVPGFVFFHPGYLRLTLDKYDEEDIENPDKLIIHLTNNCYQYKHKQYKERKEETIRNWSLIDDEIGK